MLGRIRDQGPAILCDCCQGAITDQAGLVLWKVNGPERSTVLVVHRGCESNSMVHMLFPHGYRQQPLGPYLETVLEAISV